MRVLTFNSHQPYIHLLASSLPWEFGVVLPKLPGGKVKAWDLRIRPLPENVRLYSSIEESLADTPWDWALAHNVHDLIDARPVRVPKVFLSHGTLSGRIVQDRSTIDRDTYVKSFRLLLKAERCRIVYISRLKEKDWAIPGCVISSAIDPEPYGGYRGDCEGVLQVCNHLRERGALLGWDTHVRVCAGFRNLVLGENRGVPGARVAETWDDLKDQYRAWRVYLFTAVFPYEDGYNLALLEAMATGMPIATLTHPTSPIRDGIEGVVGRDAEELRAKVAALLDDPGKALRLGSAARAKLERDFPIAAFRADWESFARKL